MIPNKKPLRLFVITTFGEVGPCGMEDLQGLLTSKSIALNDPVRQSNGRMLGPVSEVMAGRSPLTERITAPAAKAPAAPPPPAIMMPDHAASVTDAGESPGRRRSGPRQPSRRIIATTGVPARPSGAASNGLPLNRILIGVGAVALVIGISVGIAMSGGKKTVVATQPAVDAPQSVPTVAVAVMTPPVVEKPPAAATPAAVPVPTAAPTPPPAPVPVPVPTPTASISPAAVGSATMPTIAWDPCDQGDQTQISRNNGSGWASGWTDRKLTWEADPSTGATRGHLVFLSDPHVNERAERRLARPIDGGSVWIALHAQVQFGTPPKTADKTQWTSFHLLRDLQSPMFVFGFTRRNNTVTWHGFPKGPGKIPDTLRCDIPVRDTTRPGWLVLHLDLNRQGSVMTMWADPPAGREPERASGQQRDGIPFSYFEGLRFSGNSAELRMHELRIGRTWHEVAPPH